MQQYQIAVDAIETFLTAYNAACATKLAKRQQVLRNDLATNTARLQELVDTIEYTRVDSRIKDWTTGAVVFERLGVEVPAQWSQTATDILAQKYMRKAGVPLETTPVDEPNIPVWAQRCEPVQDSPLGAEASSRDTFHRIAGCWTYWALRSGYFAFNVRDSEQVRNELARQFYLINVWLLAMQWVAPNSPQWFNTGVHWAYGITSPLDGGYYWNDATSAVEKTNSTYVRPQPHACFIQGITDTLVNDGGIMDLWMREATVFKFGSGSGTNFSNLRGVDERLSSGGRSSGLMSFLKIGDAAAGSIKSGGTTRRAAKMVSVDIDHPEVQSLIRWKVEEENKVAALVAGSQLNAKHIERVLACTGDAQEDAIIDAIEAGVPESLVVRAVAAQAEGVTMALARFDLDWQSEAYATVSGQNANISIGITDAYMRAKDDDGLWWLRGRKDAAVDRELRARDLWNELISAAWASADPGVQYLDTMNAWNTCASTGTIRATNPCCFTGETLVETSEGRISFAELHAMAERGDPLPLAYAWDKRAGLPVLKQINHVWVAGRTRKLVEVTTNKGVSIRSTPEHEYYLRNGTKVEAQRLRIGDSLRKIGRVQYGGQRVGMLHRVTPESPNGTTYRNRWMWEQAYGPIPEGYEVHHVNEDSMDDRLSNFELRQRPEHRSYHATGAKNNRFIPVTDAQLIEIHDAIVAAPRNNTQGAVVTPARWNTYIKNNGLAGRIPLAASSGRIQGQDWDTFIARITNAREAVNDKVVGVRKIKLDTAVRVYDMEVADVHNFAVVDTADPLVSPLVVSNSEYVFLDDTACNLASMNLVALRRAGDAYFARAIEAVSRVYAIVLDVSVEMAQFPSAIMAENSYKYRTLGLGYANLGSLLMRMGLRYGSEESRTITQCITSTMTAAVYDQSAHLAQLLEPFHHYAANRESMLTVIDKHKAASDAIRATATTRRLGFRADALWYAVAKNGTVWGYRNAQATVLAPTGTIGLVMDCDTTGIEPDFSLVKWKSLAGGGGMQLINQGVSEALRTMGVGANAQGFVIEAILGGAAVETLGEYLSPDQIAVFDCAVAVNGGARQLHYMDHLRVMAAAQPYLSGGISKTVNLPADAKLADIDAAYTEGHRLGLKAIAVYRDGSKLSQPLMTAKVAAAKARVRTTSEAARLDVLEHVVHRLQRRRPPNRRTGYTQRAMIASHKLYHHTGEFEDGTLAEVFIDVAKEGATLRAVFNSLAIAISIGLQYGVPLEEFVEAFVFTKFEPAGPVQGHDNIRMTESFVDYLFRDLAINYLGRDDLANVKPTRDADAEASARTVSPGNTSGVVMVPEVLLTEDIHFETMSGAHVVRGVPVSAADTARDAGYTGDMCTNCNSFRMKRAGSCMVCESCGTTTGCS